MEKKREGVIEGMSRIVSDPYYFLHFMAFFSYLPIRSSAAPYTSHRLLDREIQAFLAFLMFSAIKVLNFLHINRICLNLLLLHFITSSICRWWGKKHGRLLLQIVYSMLRLNLADFRFRIKIEFIVTFRIHSESADTHLLAPDLSHSCFVDYGLSSGDLV